MIAIVILIITDDQTMIPHAMNEGIPNATMIRMNAIIVTKLPAKTTFGT